MTVVFANTAEGGTDNNAATTLNTGGDSGNAFGTVNLTGDGAATFEADMAAHGALGYQLSAGSGNVAEVRPPVWSGVSVVELVWYVTQPATPGAIYQHCAIRSSSSGCGLNHHSTAGRWDVTNAAGSSINNTSASFTTVPGTKYRFQLLCGKGTGTTDGRIEFRVYDGDSTTPLHTYVATNVNAGTLDLTNFRMGKVSGAAAAITVGVDSIRVYTGAEADGSAKPEPTPDITETLTDNVAMIEATDGTPPFSIAQDSGTTTAPTELDDGTVSGIGRWIVAKHSADTLVYTVTDSALVDSDPYNIPPISPANIQIRRPSGTPPGTTWA